MAKAVQKPIFFDSNILPPLPPGVLLTSAESVRDILSAVVHSNNAARIRLWLRLKQLETVIEPRTVVYADLQSPEFAAVNPLKKVPALIDANGDCVFESFVIMQYVEDKYGHLPSPYNFMMDTPEGGGRRMTGRT